MSECRLAPIGLEAASEISDEGVKVFVSERRVRSLRVFDFELDDLEEASSLSSLASTLFALCVGAFVSGVLAVAAGLRTGPVFVVALTISIVSGVMGAYFGLVFRRERRRVSRLIKRIRGGDAR